MDLDQMQVKISLNKSNTLVAFTSVLSHFICHFYVSDDVVYGGVINNHNGPNEQHAKSVNYS